MMKKLFEELWWFSDEVEPMKEFCKTLTTWCEWVKFYAKAKVIDPHELGFNSSPYIIHNYSENVIIEKADKTIEYLIECYEEYDDKEYWKEFWIPRIQKIIKKYE